VPIIILLLLFWSFGASSHAAATEVGASQRLAAMADEYWDYVSDEEPATALMAGRPAKHLYDVSYRHARASADWARAFRERLRRISVAELSEKERVSYQFLDWLLEQRISALEFYWLSIPITPIQWNQINGPAFNLHPLRDSRDLNSYVALASQYAAYVRAIRGIVERQLKMGIVLPKPALEKARRQFDALVEKPEMSPLMVEKERLTAIPPAEASAFQNRISAIVIQKVNPELKRLRDFLAGDYAQRAPAEVGQWVYPRGKEYYRYLVRTQTTMDLSPEEIHRRGLAEVDRIEKEMAQLREKIGFKGSREQFHQLIKTDPRFFAKTPEEVRRLLLGYADAIKDKMPAYFDPAPTHRFDVRRLAAASEDGMTFGYYQPPTETAPTGIYFFNGSKLEERSTLEAEHLIYHELIPGHHLQVSLAQESSSVPTFQSQAVYLGIYSDGWAEYAAEILAPEMGMFQDPYSRYGRLVRGELFMAVRLVVDTGMNDFGWPLEKARAYMRDKLLESETQIDSETLRYATDYPAQALVYNLGMHRIAELRARTREQLGKRFDIKAFHRAVLENGSLPMSVLDRHVQAYVDSTLAQATTPAQPAR